MPADITTIHVTVLVLVVTPTFSPDTTGIRVVFIVIIPYTRVINRSDAADDSIDITPADDTVMFLTDTITVTIIITTSPTIKCTISTTIDTVISKAEVPPVPQTIVPSQFTHPGAVHTVLSPIIIRCFRFRVCPDEDRSVPLINVTHRYRFGPSCRHRWSYRVSFDIIIDMRMVI